VVLDLYLPDMMGSDLCAEIRANRATLDIPIILCTAHQISLGEKMKGFRAGVDDYLVRPFELAELHARIEALLRRAKKTPNAEILKGIHAVLQPQKSHPLETSSSSARRQPSSPFIDREIDSSVAPKSSEPLHLVNRVWEALNFPSRLFREPREHDFLTALILVLLTPILGSLPTIFQSSLGFDAWIGRFSLGLITHLFVWIGTAGLIHMAVPFLGLNLPMKNALTIAGLAWAPRLIGSALSVFYLLFQAVGITPEVGDFSAGIDLVPGIPSADWSAFLGRIGAFDVWCVWITLTAIWILAPHRGKKWNSVTILIGLICLAFGALAHP